MFDIILCTDSKQGISKNNTIPWDIKEDLQYFKNITTNTTLPNMINAVIMGKNTFKSINKPLPDRVNIIVSKTITLDDLFRGDKGDIDNKYNSNTIEHNNLYITRSLEEALELTYKLPNIQNRFVIGGKPLYQQALLHRKLRNIYHTVIHHDYDCDNHVKLNLHHHRLIQTHTIQSKHKVDFNVYSVNHINEAGYLNLLEECLTKGDYRQTRNAKTYSMFGKQLVFDLTRFPLLTTKKLNLRIIFEELMFFLRGKTDVQILKDKNVNIWTQNTTQKFIDDNKLPLKENDMGAMYPFQFRHFGVEYKDKDTDYTNKGFDQIEYVIKEIKSNPHSRRIMFTSFNPYDAYHKSVLYPCHSIVVQFYVDKNKLSCHMYQRSADVFLGLPFNIASTALLTYLVCDVVNNSDDYKGEKLSPGNMCISLGDVHVYDNHREAVLEQLKREVYEPPMLKVKDSSVDKSVDEYEGKSNGKCRKIDEYEYTDIVLQDYICGSIIKADMVA